MSEFGKRLGRVIATTRRARRWTQAELAERLSVTNEWISQVERGVGSPSLPFLDALADAFGIPVDDLVVAAASRSGPPRPLLDSLSEQAGRLPDASLRVLLATAEALEREQVALAAEDPRLGG